MIWMVAKFMQFRYDLFALVLALMVEPNVEYVWNEYSGIFPECFFYNARVYIR